jgi:hypothetical protein
MDESGRGIKGGTTTSANVIARSGPAFVRANGTHGRGHDVPTASMGGVAGSPTLGTARSAARLATGNNSLDAGTDGDTSGIRHGMHLQFTEMGSDTACARGSAAHNNRRAMK